ncbi:MAG: 50S ribosomal protein L16 [Patescibacteria group bacterium]|nr:50S ribosomal protein L16 [Patescibacteria group bacterium]
MLMPRRMKYRKQMKMPVKGKSHAGNEIAFGDYAIKAITGRLITARQLEAARRAVTHHVKRGAKIWIRVFPHKPRTTHGEGQRMGKGKGAVDHFAAVIKPGKIIFEMKGANEELSMGALRRAAAKLPIKTKIISVQNSL